MITISDLKLYFSFWPIERVHNKQLKSDSNKQLNSDNTKQHDSGHNKQLNSDYNHLL